jgi:hypothetical protein
MNLLPLADRLAAQSVGTEGESIFVNMMPVECDLGVLLRNRLSGTVINYEIPGYYKAQFQMIVRAGNYADGEALMAQATAALTVVETAIGNYFFNYCRPKTMPVAFPLSQGDNLEFSVYMECNFYVEGN